MATGVLTVFNGMLPLYEYEPWLIPSHITASKYQRHTQLLPGITHQESAAQQSSFNGHRAASTECASDA